MSCGTCSVIPDFFPVFIPYREGDLYPWTKATTTIPDPAMVVPADKVAYNLGFQAYNILEGDILTWRYKFYSGGDYYGTWIPIDGVAGYPTSFGVPNGRTFWSEEDSINQSLWFPNNQETRYLIQLRVEREGCPTLVKEKELTIAGTNITGEFFADKWELTIDGELLQEIYPDPDNDIWNIENIENTLNVAENYLPCAPCFEGTEVGITTFADADLLSRLESCKSPLNVDHLLSILD